jgi:multiple sugar transport system permease protein
MTVNSKRIVGRYDLLITLGRYLIMMLIALVMIFPLVFMVISSLKPDMQLLQDSSSLRAFLPVGDISIDNYIAMFDRAPVGRFIFNSVLVTTITVALGLWINSMAAFSLAVLEWRGKRFVLAVIIATFIIPFETVAIPLLLVVNNLPWITAEGFVIGWMNSYHVQIIPFIADSLSIFLFVQYFRDLPKELIEAARIDGANWWQIYSTVFVPISGPVFATVAILKFLAMWNQYLWPLMVVRSEEFRPVMVGVQYFFQLNTAWGEVMAYLSSITIPVIIFYLLLQRAFIESIASTGIKG